MKNYLITPGKKFEEYSEELKNNKFFMFNYFSNVESNNKEYKYIPKDCLEDQYFVFKCIEKNPDIYLLADKVQSDEMFDFIKEKQPNNFLKYASEKQIKDKSFCLSAIEKTPYNYPYLPLELREDKNLIKKIFTNLYRPGTISGHIPKSVIKDREFMIDLMSGNTDIFYGLKKYFRKDKEIMKVLVLTRSSLFSDVDEELKADQSWVGSILEQKRKWEKEYNYHSIRNFSVSEIITELPIEYFQDQSFVNENLKEITKDFPRLKKEIRSSDVLLKTIYSEKSIEVMPKDLDSLMKKDFVKKITDDNLRVSILDLVDKTKWYYNNDEEKLVDFQKFIKAIDYYYLGKELNKKEEDRKKFKI